MLIKPPKAQRPIFAKAAKIAVEIDAGGSISTGIVLTKDGIILTAEHSVRGYERVLVRRLRLNSKHWVLHTYGGYDADVIATDRTADLALLRIVAPPKTLAAATLRRKGPVKDEPCYRVGRDNYEVASGYIHFSKEGHEGLPEVWSGMPSYYGASGGPLVDKTGRVIGIVSCALMSTEPKPPAPTSFL